MNARKRRKKVHTGIVISSCTIVDRTKNTYTSKYCKMANNGTLLITIIINRRNKKEETTKNRSGLNSWVILWNIYILIRIHRHIEIIIMINEHHHHWNACIGFGLNWFCLVPRNWLLLLLFNYYFNCENRLWQTQKKS